MYEKEKFIIITSMNEYSAFARKLAYESWKVMLEYFYGTNKLSQKKSGDLVGEADIKINKLVIQRVKEYFPMHWVYGEEESYNDTTEYLWCCDPIDGTIPFSRNIPTACFSLALLKEGRPIVSVCYQPFLDELYEAQEGSGARLNGDRIYVSKQDLNDKYTMVNCITRPSMPYDMSWVFRELMTNGNRMLEFRTIVYAWCLLARWSIEGLIFPHNQPFDCAAIDLLVREAWGTSTSLFGEKQKFNDLVEGNLMSNWVIHDDLIALVNKYTQ